MGASIALCENLIRCLFNTALSRHTLLIGLLCFPEGKNLSDFNQMYISGLQNPGAELFPQQSMSSCFH